MPAPAARYLPQLGCARAMLATLGVLLDHHVQDHASGCGDHDFEAELDALCPALGEAAICITATL